MQFLAGLKALGGGIGAFAKNASPLLGLAGTGLQYKASKDGLAFSREQQAKQELELQQQRNKQLEQQRILAEASGAFSKRLDDSLKRAKEQKQKNLAFSEESLKPLRERQELQRRDPIAYRDDLIKRAKQSRGFQELQSAIQAEDIKRIGGNAGMARPSSASDVNFSTVKEQRLKNYLDSFDNIERRQNEDFEKSVIQDMSRKNQFLDQQSREEVEPALVVLDNLYKQAGINTESQRDYLNRYRADNLRQQELTQQKAEAKGGFFNDLFEEAEEALQPKLGTDDPITREEIKKLFLEDRIQNPELKARMRELLNRDKDLEIMRNKALSASDNMLNNLTRSNYKNNNND